MQAESTESLPPSGSWYRRWWVTASFIGAFAALATATLLDPQQWAASLAPDGGPLHADALTGAQEITRTPMIYNYETTFVRGRFGRGAAMAYLSGLVLFAMSIVYMRLALRERDV